MVTKGKTWDYRSLLVKGEVYLCIPPNPNLDLSITVIWWLPLAVPAVCPELGHSLMAGLLSPLGNKGWVAIIPLRQLLASQAGGVSP